MKKAVRSVKGIRRIMTEAYALEQLNENNPAIVKLSGYVQKLGHLSLECILGDDYEKCTPDRSGRPSKDVVGSPTNDPGIEGGPEDITVDSTEPIGREE
jgi:hypothetical protein